MLDAIRTLLLAGVGAIDLTEDKARSIAAELVRRGELAADEARDWVGLWERRTATASRVSDRLDAAIDEALGERNLASHETVAELDARVSRLEAIVERWPSIVRQP